MNAPSATDGDAVPPPRIDIASRTGVIPTVQAPSTVAARFARIDVLRALAAITVVAYHILGEKIAWHWTWGANGLAQVNPLAASTYVSRLAFFHRQHLRAARPPSSALHQRNRSSLVCFWRAHHHHSHLGDHLPCDRTARHRPGP